MDRGTNKFSTAYFIVDYYDQHTTIHVSSTESIYLDSHFVSVFNLHNLLPVPSLGTIGASCGRLNGSLNYNKHYLFRGRNSTGISTASRNLRWAVPGTTCGWEGTRTEQVENEGV